MSLTADGKLPDLHLTESESAGSKPAKASKRSPVLMFGLICFSLVTSVMLVLVDVSPPAAQPDAAKWNARRIIEEEYFSSLDSPEPRERYQILLRDAQRAHARGDDATERKLYGEVLDLLRAERGPFDSVTGTPARDRRLEEQLVILLRKD